MDIEIVLATQYRSFRRGVTANNLSDFVVLTGGNGSGKSQLMQILTVRGFLNPIQPEAFSTLTVSGQQIPPTEIVGIFDWNLPVTPVAGMAELNNYSVTVHGTIMSMLQGHLGVDENLFSREQIEELQQLAERFRSEGYGPPHRLPSIEEVTDRLPARFADKSAQIINERIAAIIYDWHVTALQERRDYDVPENPIAIFNELCKSFTVDFTLPKLTDIRKSYNAVLINTDGDPVQWQDLSSGEKVIFRIICWLFYHRTRHKMYPKVLLLDEPDAHLTPTMIRRFLKQLHETVFEQMGIAVVLTSHSPNTVALAEEGSLYVLERTEDGQRQINKTTRQESLRRLSEGLLFVQEETRLVFVEGVDDPPFYETLYTRSVSAGHVDNVPSLKFIAASNAQPEAGGLTKVLEVISRFDGTSVAPIVTGLVDRDVENKPSRGIWVIKRYSIENYLYDPFLVVCNLVIQGKQDALQALRGIETGDWRMIVDNSALRQAAVDEVVASTHLLLLSEIAEGGYPDELVEVSWTTSDSNFGYTLPAWLVNMKGKTYTAKGLHQEASPLKNVTSRREQYLALSTIQAVPSDILEIFRSMTAGAGNESSFT